MKLAAALLAILLIAIQRPATTTLEGSFARQGTSEGIADVNAMLISLNSDLPQTPDANQAVQSLATALLRPLSSTLAKTETAQLESSF